MCAGFGLIVCTCIIHTEVTESVCVCAGFGVIVCTCIILTEVTESVCVCRVWTDSVYMYNTY